MVTIFLMYSRLTKQKKKPIIYLTSGDGPNEKPITFYVNFYNHLQVTGTYYISFARLVSLKILPFRQ